MYISMGFFPFDDSRQSIAIVPVVREMFVEIQKGLSRRVSNEGTAMMFGLGWKWLLGCEQRK
ncbi:hypothetical protein [Polaromonas sp. UC242_47]|uniref:hypothetical protein n=1 Tax=Polaromonas sp. UC242_47 TaxID=3374626 RepID=UPI0037A54F56